MEARARNAERAATISGARDGDSAGRHPRSARRVRATASTRAVWISAAAPGGAQTDGIAESSSESALATVVSSTGTQRATVMSRSSWMDGATRPAATVSAARRETAANQASESLRLRLAGSARSQRAARSAVRRTVDGRIVSPSGSVISTDARWPWRSGLSAQIVKAW